MENRLPPSLTDLVASFEATKERSLKARDDTSFLQHMLETGFRTVPDALDSERCVPFSGALLVIESALWLVAESSPNELYSLLQA